MNQKLNISNVCEMYVYIRESQAYNLGVYTRVWTIKLRNTALYLSAEEKRIICIHPLFTEELSSQKLLK